ncbi:MAG: hypothetical protein ACD_33C00045G0009 [uncultured bacterium]|nr:MAG: hypothetical protein ACD_33C00045G0009 [uncultured bacterium]
MAINFKSDNIQKFKHLSDAIKTNLKADGSSIKETETHSAYIANLPEGITKDTVEDISKYNSKFVTAAHIAVGELSSEIMKKDKSVETVEAEIGYFGKNDSLSITVNREKTYQNYLAKDGDPKEVVKHLVMNTTATIHSAKGSSLKSVKESMSEEFQGMFKK